MITMSGCSIGQYTLRPVVPPSGRGTSRRGPRKRGVPRRMGHGGSIFLLPSWEVKGEWRPFQWPFSEQHCAQTGEYLMRLISRVQKILGRTFATRVQSGLGALAGKEAAAKSTRSVPCLASILDFQGKDFSRNSTLRVCTKIRQKDGEFAQLNTSSRRRFA